MTCDAPQGCWMLGTQKIDLKKRCDEQKLTNWINQTKHYILNNYTSQQVKDYKYQTNQNFNQAAFVMKVSFAEQQQLPSSPPRVESCEIRLFRNPKKSPPNPIWIKLPQKPGSSKLLFISINWIPLKPAIQLQKKMVRIPRFLQEIFPQLCFQRPSAASKGFTNIDGPWLWSENLFGCLKSAH